MEAVEKYHILDLIKNHGFCISQSLSGSPSRTTYFYELINKAQNMGISKHEIQKAYDIGYEKGIDKIMQTSLRKTKRIKK
ncbi:hypothetical protein [Legionella worsleiensis]|uniref:hypothetical protein n=1 Tax=Legionella worsleiensis TaxID=45076 RepID=UPI000E051A17|nr:hypothetical protein [Legionella worsleiensis]STY50015.1 Uncharacterised protein [Legionella worsleiensis]